MTARIRANDQVLDRLPVARHGDDHAGHDAPPQNLVDNRSDRVQGLGRHVTDPSSSDAV
jgi:hypothetical protein